MSTASNHLAIDLGAESGRLMLGRVSPDAISLDEVHRCPADASASAGRSGGTSSYMWGKIIEALGKVARSGETVRSISVDTWGVDYVHLLDGHPHLAPPFMYRDPRVKGRPSRT